MVPGVGPGRERRLWADGVTDWAQLPAADTRLPGPVHAALCRQLEAAELAAARGDVAAIAATLPMREHWRLFGTFERSAVYLDIECGREGITAIGLLDDGGPRILLGDDIAQFPEALGPDAILVTFNGASFDVPLLRRAFPSWEPPAAHIDLKHLWGRLGFGGGLKALEERLGFGRPDHLRGIDGRSAGGLYRAADWGGPQALHHFAEYNLYDTINLRTLLGLGYNRMVDALALPCPPVRVSYRGDVLYDVSRLLLSLRP